MSILNVDKIQPIGGGSTITVDATDIQATSATITASSFVGSITGNTISFETAGSERARITSAGKVGINTNNPLGDMLTVCEFNSGTNIYDNIALRLQGSSGQNVALQFTDTTGAAAYIAVQGDALRLGTNNAERLRIASDGGVGIGTNAGYGDAKLTVEGTAALTNNDTTLQIKDNVSDDAAGRGGNIGFGAYVNGTMRTLGGIGALKKNAGNSFNGDLALYTRENGQGNLSERLRIISTGNVGIGTQLPSEKLTVHTASGNTKQVLSSHAGFSELDFVTASTLRADVFANASEFTFTTRTAIPMVFRTNGTNERLRIDSNGRLLVSRSGLTASKNVGTKTGEIQVAASGNNAAITLINYSNDASSPYLMLGKSRAGNTTGNTIVQADDRLGEIAFCGADGNDIDSFGAAIKAWVDGTPGNNDMPGRLVFYTTPDGSQTAQERLRIKSDGDIVATGSIKSNNLSGRNVVINGDMRVVQRATSASMSNHGATIDVCDRWIYSRHGVTATVAQVAEAPAGRGFKYSLKWTSTSAVGSIAAGNSLKFAYNIERQDIQRLGYGSSNAKKATLSFWAKGSIAGKIGVSCTRNSRITSHNVDMTANTWEFHEIVIPIDTSTALSGTDTDSGFYIGICWGGGSNSTSGATNGWIGFHNAYTAGFTAGQQGAYLTTSGSTFQITGVQLEVGSVSTPFEHKLYAEELRLCQRYYNEVANTRNQSGNDCTLGMFCQVYNSTGAHIIHQLDPPMRVVPDLVTTQSSGSYVLIVGNSSDTFDQIIENSKNRWTNRNVELWCQTGLSGLTPGQAAFVRLRSAVSTTVVAFDAEL